MAYNLSATIKKLQMAINIHYDERVLVNRQQWYSEDKKAPQTMYVIKKAVYNTQKKRNENIELFSSPSQVQILLFLRDYWYQLTGREVPEDNERWNKAKARYYEKRDKKKEIV